jgi:hypothetical protein
VAFKGVAKPKGSISAVVKDKDGKVIADLGMIAGGKPDKAEKKRQKDLLAKLKRDRTKAEKEARHGG